MTQISTTYIHSIQIDEHARHKPAYRLADGSYLIEATLQASETVDIQWWLDGQTMAISPSLHVSFLLEHISVGGSGMPCDAHLDRHISIRKPMIWNWITQWGVCRPWRCKYARTCQEILIAARDYVLSEILDR